MSGALTTALRPSGRSAVWRAPAGLVLPLALLTAWQGATQADLVSPLILPTPHDVALAFLDMARDGTLAANLGISLRRLAAGYALGAGAGLALGAVTGLSARAHRLLWPMLQAVMQVPMLAWIPLLMIPFGISEALKYAGIGIAALAPVLLHANRAFRQAPAGLLDVARIYHLRPWQILTRILVPAACPEIFAGLRLGLTQAWQALVVVELVASTEGIGYVAVMARQVFRLDQMFAAMVAIGLVGFALDLGVRAVERVVPRRWNAAS